MVKTFRTWLGSCCPKKSGRVRSSWSYLATVTRCSWPRGSWCCMWHPGKKKECRPPQPLALPDDAVRRVSHKLYRFCRKEFTVGNTQGR